MKTPTSLFHLLVALLVTTGLSVTAADQNAPSVTPGRENPAAQQPSSAPRETPPHDAGKKGAAHDAGGEASTQVVDRRDNFTRLDTDRDGRVSAKEYAASDLAAVTMIAEGKRQGSETAHGGFNLVKNEGRPERSEFFRRLDTDKDGFLSQSEVAAADKPMESKSRR